MRTRMLVVVAVTIGVAASAALGAAIAIRASASRLERELRDIDGAQAIHVTFMNRVGEKQAALIHALQEANLVRALHDGADEPIDYAPVAQWWCRDGVGDCFRERAQCDKRPFTCEPRRVAFCSGDDCYGGLNECKVYGAAKGYPATQRACLGVE